MIKKYVFISLYISILMLPLSLSSNTVQISTTTYESVSRTLKQIYPDFRLTKDWAVRWIPVSDNKYIFGVYGNINNQYGCNVFLVNSLSNSVYNVAFIPSVYNQENWMSIEKVIENSFEVAEYTDYGVELNRIKFFFNIDNGSVIGKYRKYKLNITDIKKTDNFLTVYARSNEIKLTITADIEKDRILWDNRRISHLTSYYYNTDISYVFPSTAAVMDNVVNNNIEFKVIYPDTSIVINTNDYVSLSYRYDEIYPSEELLRHIITVSSEPVHSYFVLAENSKYMRDYGVYEINAEDRFYYPLPTPSLDMIRKNRGNDCYNTEHTMGGFYIDRDKIWFCYDFYNGEGSCGLGGVGYFDLNNKKYNIYRSSEIVALGCSSLYVRDNNVFIGLTNYPEGTKSFEGLMIWDIANKKSEVIKGIDDVITSIEMVADTLVVGTDDGIYLFDMTSKRVSYIGPEENLEEMYKFVNINIH